MAEIAQRLTDALEVSSFGVGDVGSHPDLLEDLFRRRRIGAILRGVFPEAAMSDVASRLDEGVDGVPRAVAPTFSGGLYGRPLVMGAEDLKDYLDDAELFRSGMRGLFASLGGLEERIASQLRAMAGGRPVEVARTEEGREYLPVTFRALVEGDSLPIHYENGTAQHDSMKPLLRQIDPEALMSFYIPLTLPESGGVLEVYTTDCSGDGERIIGDLGGPEKAKVILAERGFVEVRPGVGDMLVFDGGRHYHLVTEVRGARSRWTLGGFFAFTKDHGRILYWS